MNNTYRKYKKGDKVAIVGFNGRLYSNGGIKALNDNYQLGHVCTLTDGEDSELDVKIPSGILKNDNIYIHISCISLVEPVEENKKAVIEHNDGCSLFEVLTPDRGRKLAYVWYDDLTREQAEKLANDVKAAYDATH